MVFLPLGGLVADHMHARVPLGPLPSKPQLTHSTQREYSTSKSILGPKLFFVTGLVLFVTAEARLVCPDLLG